MSSILQFLTLLFCVLYHLSYRYLERSVASTESHLRKVNFRWSCSTANNQIVRHRVARLAIEHNMAACRADRVGKLIFRCVSWWPAIWLAPSLDAREALYDRLRNRVGHALMFTAKTMLDHWKKQSPSTVIRIIVHRHANVYWKLCNKRQTIRIRGECPLNDFFLL